MKADRVSLPFLFAGIQCIRQIEEWNISSRRILVRIGLPDNGKRYWILDGTRRIQIPESKFKEERSIEAELRANGERKAPRRKKRTIKKAGFFKERAGR